MMTVTMALATHFSEHIAAVRGQSPMETQTQKTAPIIIRVSSAQVVAASENYTLNHRSIWVPILNPTICVICLHGPSTRVRCPATPMAAQDVATAEAIVTRGVVMWFLG